MKLEDLGEISSGETLELIADIKEKNPEAFESVTRIAGQPLDIRPGALKRAYSKMEGKKTNTLAISTIVVGMVLKFPGIAEYVPPEYHSYILEATGVMIGVVSWLTKRAK